MKNNFKALIASQNINLINEIKNEVGFNKYETLQKLQFDFSTDLQDALEQMILNKDDYKLIILHVPFLDINYDFDLNDQIDTLLKYKEKFQQNTKFIIISHFRQYDLNEYLRIKFATKIFTSWHSNYRIIEEMQKAFTKKLSEV